MDDIIVFHPLEKSDIEKIVEIQLDDVRKRLKDKHISLVLDQAAKDFLIEKGYDKLYGARQMKRTIQKYVEDALAEELLRGTIKEGESVTLNSGGDKLIFAPASPSASPAAV